jgi:putative peptidoglycan lipid II flippase
MTRPQTDRAVDGAGRGVLRSSLVVSLMTMLSRVLGLARDIVIASWFGAGSNTDAFFVAFKVPQFLRRLFAEGAFSQAFVPVLSEYRERAAAEVKGLVNAVCGALGLVLAAVTGFAVLAAPLVTALFAPGFIAVPDKFALTSEMIRITFPYLLLISLTGFAGAILNSHGRFAVPAFTPVLLNLSLIAAAVLLSPQLAEPVLALAWAVLFAGVAQLGFQLPFLARLQLLPRPVVDLRHEGVRRIGRLMVPALFGVSVSQINLLLDTVLASFLPTGSISWLYYSDRLAELPLGVFGIAIATVILPTLSRQHAAESPERFAALLDWGLKMVLMIALPAALALAILAEPILVTLFQYGALGARDIDMAALSLMAYAAGLPAFMLIKVLASGFYARQDMKTPVTIGITAMVANMILNLALVLPLHHLYGIGHVGLALATSLAAWLNAGLLLRGLLRADAYRPDAASRRELASMALAAIAMVAGLLLVLPWLDGLAGMRWLQRILHLLTVCAAGAGAYFLLLLAQRPRFLLQRPA